MRTVTLVIALGLGACAGTSGSASRQSNTASSKPPPHATPYDQRQGPGTTYQSAQPGIFNAPGSSGDVEGNPGVDD